MDRKTLIDDGYYEEVLLLSPQKTAEILRNMEKPQQRGMGKSAEKSYVEFDKEQAKYNGFSNLPKVEDNPLLTQLKRFEGLGSDHIISRFYKYKQYEKLLKDYFEKNIPLPNGFSVEDLIREQRTIMKEHGRQFVSLGLGNITVDAQRITGRQMTPNVPKEIRFQDNNDDEGQALRLLFGDPEEDEDLFPQPVNERKDTSLTTRLKKRGLEEFVNKYGEKYPEIAHKYNLRKRKIKSMTGEGLGNDGDEIEEGEITYPIPIFKKKWKKVTAT